MYKSDLIYTGFDLSDESKIAEYVKSQHDAYVASQTGLVSDNPDKVDLTQFVSYLLIRVHITKR